jgi:hypothetical protein
VFNKHDTDRIAEWKHFRDYLEQSPTPYEDVANLWGRAPFVENYLDHTLPDTWPDPWHILVDDRLDNLAICLGMLYTFKLTERFKDTPCEIFRLTDPRDRQPVNVLAVDNKHVLNWDIREVVDMDRLKSLEIKKIWEK